jgi:hypothetical protein
VKALVASALALGLGAPLFAEDVVEPRSGVKFSAKLQDASGADMSLIGAGLRKRAFFKVYAIGLYVADSALAGPLAQHKGKGATAALYNDLVWGDYPKQVVMKFTRNVGQGKIQDAMREALQGADKPRLDAFVSYFPEVKEGQECVLRWGTGGRLEATMAGEAKAPIEDKDFTAAVFSIWLGQKPIQEDVKRDLVSRF